MIAETLIVAGALGVGVLIGADWRRSILTATRKDAAEAHDQAVEAQSAVGLLSNDLRDTRVELEFLEEEHHAQRERADRAEVQAASWELRARTLAAALEERTGPAIVEPSETVILFRRGHGFEGFA